MTWINKLRNVDRRVIYLMMFLAVLLPLLKPIGLPIAVTPETQSLYDVFERLQPGDYVMLSFDFDPASGAEVAPMVEAVAHHVCKKGLKVICPSLWPQGPSMCGKAFNRVGPMYGRTYGVDWVNLGYLAGGGLGQAQVELLAASIRTAYPTDVKGTRLDELPIMKGVDKLQDMKAVCSFTAGDPGLLGWLQVAKDRYNVTCGGGGTAVNTPQFYPYIQSGQICGFLNGLKGAAEYEKLVGVPGTGTSGMDAQSIGHLVIMIFIIISNVFLLIEKSEQRKGGK